MRSSSDDSSAGAIALVPPTAAAGGGGGCFAFWAASQAFTSGSDNTWISLSGSGVGDCARTVHTVSTAQESAIAKSPARTKPLSQTYGSGKMMSGFGPVGDLGEVGLGRMAIHHVGRDAPWRLSRITP